MEQQIQNTVPQKRDEGTVVIQKMGQLCELGFTLPKDYNYVNAIKASMLVLQDLTDKNKKPALEVCTPASIQKALYKMASSGLDVAKSQGYFIVKGGELCFDPSYFGKVLQVKRVYPKFEPIVNIVYQGDDFTYTTDPNTLHKKVIRHEQSLDSLEGDWKAAYMYLPTADGDSDLYIMTKKQIWAAWSKSPNGAVVAKIFPEKMIRKTVINTGCNMIINSTPELSSMAVDEDFEAEHTPVDVPSHEVTEVNMDATPVTNISTAKVEAKKVEIPTPPPSLKDLDF